MCDYNFTRADFSQDSVLSGNYHRKRENQFIGGFNWFEPLRRIDFTQYIMES